MIFSSLILLATATIISCNGFMGVVSAFSTPASTRSNNIPTIKTSLASSFGKQTIDITDEYTPRDVYGMEQWALQNGVQKVDGVELASATSDGMDWQLITNQDIPVGNPVLYVPAGMVMSSNAIRDELGGNLEAAENALVQQDVLTAQRLPLFRLMVKILMEYENGQDSPYFPWLNSLPKRFYNGVAMTDTCFECLPPYASMLAKAERDNYLSFCFAIRQGYMELESSTTDNDVIVQWAYNVALTRFTEVWQPTRQKLIAPMADMFNHASNPNVEVTFDEEGNCVVQATDNIPAGSPLTISLGNPSNPTPIFATYGFLYNDCSTVFCKALHLLPQIEDLGYNFNDLLFQVDNGNVATKVYDIFLYKMLQDNDMSLAEQFLTACRTNNEDLRQSFHQEYFGYTLNALQEHVGSILYDVDRLTQKAQSLDLNTHPRAPIIVAHNNLVRETFSRTQVNLQNVG